MAISWVRWLMREHSHPLQQLQLFLQQGVHKGG